MSEYIEQLVEEAIQIERERIINLLEPYSKCQSNDYCWPRCECIRSDFFLGLIKGEQK